MCNSPLRFIFFVAWPLRVLWRWNRALQKNNFSGSDFFRTCTASNRDLEHCLPNNSVKTTYWQTLLDAQKVPHQDSNLRPSRLRSNTLTITLQEPCLQGILLSDSLSLLWLQRAGFSMGCSCGKTIFQALKTCFFPHLLLWHSEKHRLCKNTQLFRL